MTTARGAPPPVRACLFDMDGLLIDSEDKYTWVVNTILAENSRPPLPWSIKAQLQGRPGPAAGAIFRAWAQLPMSQEAFAARTAELQREAFPSCALLPGVGALLGTLDGTRAGEAGRVYMALATSSHAGNYALKTGALGGTFALFPDECRVLGDDERIAKGRGKPCPDIYLLALRTVNDGIRRRNAARGEGEQEETEVRPEECLVFEDSVPGVESGRRAGMQVIWVPHQGLLAEYKGKEKEVLAGRSGMDHEELRGEGEPPGGIDDGWAKLAQSLEDFDYAGYGINV